MKKQIILENIRLGKLVHGGQCLAETPEGKKLFVWGGLPGELVDVRVTKKKSSYLEGVAVLVHESSKDRVEPREEEVYLSSSPWQIMTFEAENSAKQAILEETFEREHVNDISWTDFYAGEAQYGYRNKVELGFWGDDDGIHFASYIRGTHGKRIITSNALASDAINSVLDDFKQFINDFVLENSLRAGDLKTVIFRSSSAGEVVAALFIKKNDVKLKEVKMLNGVENRVVTADSTTTAVKLRGLSIYYSDPKSPASVITEELYRIGDITLMDEVMGKNIMYDVNSFFQVNLPVFEEVMSTIVKYIDGNNVADFYSGVGTIGVPLGASMLIESDSSNIAMAKQNAGDSTKLVHATSEDAIEYITSDHVLVVDPPRAGLHKDVVHKILEVLPPKVVYLSCNPSTQARDVALLHEQYKIVHAQGFNFFPRTPHIESLIVLEKK